jgi:hypothetical protein
MESQPRKDLPIGTVILFALVFVLFFVMLANISFSTGGGEASFSQAIASLFSVFGLWVALALLLVIAAIFGTMPRWSAVAAFLLVPLSGVAATVAIDMCSRHIRPAIVVPIVLPLLIILYAGWARWPGVHARFPSREVSLTAWGLVFGVSVATLILAIYF